MPFNQITNDSGIKIAAAIVIHMAINRLHIFFPNESLFPKTNTLIYYENLRDLF